MKKLHLVFFTLAPLVLGLSCTKKVIEITPVIEYEDISLPSTADVRCFSFPVPDIGYAGADAVYKTNDGGKSWNKQSLAGTITAIEFTDASTGYCITSQLLYKTVDGGQNWKFIRTADIFGISENGVLVTGINTGLKCRLDMSKNGGTSFVQLRSIAVRSELELLRIIDNKAFVIEAESYDDYIPGIDLLDTSKYVRLGIEATAYESINDVYIDHSGGVAVGNKGHLADLAHLHDYYLYEGGRTYYGHRYDFNSVDGYGDLKVAVGYRTIVSTLDIENDEKWNEVFDTKRNGFEQTFLKVRFFDAHTIFISGTNGLLWKAKL